MSEIQKNAVLITGCSRGIGLGFTSKIIGNISVLKQSNRQCIGPKTQRRRSGIRHVSIENTKKKGPDPNREKQERPLSQTQKE